MYIKHFNLVVHLILIPVLVLSNYMFSRFKFRVLMSSIMMFGSSLLSLFCMGFWLYLCFLSLFTYTGVHHYFYIRSCPCRLTVKRMVSLVELQLLILPKHMSSSSVFSGFKWINLQFSVQCFVDQIVLAFLLKLCANWRNSKYQFYNAFRFMRSPSGMMHSNPT